jgi:hypothetical protein
VTWQDLINASFEAFGAVAILMHCSALYKAKNFEGVSLSSCIFFWAWGVWNLYYYPHLGQLFSFAAGVAIMLANCLWIGLLLYYRKYPGGYHDKKSEKPSL